MLSISYKGERKHSQGLMKSSNLFFAFTIRCPLPIEHKGHLNDFSSLTNLTLIKTFYGDLLLYVAVYPMGFMSFDILTQQLV